jgi:glycosyltransferase involved in cell wall biosynthesis
MKTPTFSVIIPTLNEEKFLPHLLDSLAAQSVQDFEVIVVDGSSKDKTQQIALSYAKKLTLKVIVSKKASLPLQRNLGAREARGEWYVFVDADSVFLPYFIERSGVFIQNHHSMAFTTWFRPDSEDAKDAVNVLFGNIYTEATVIFKRPLAPGPLTVVHRDAYHSVGGYDEAHAFHEDVDFGLRLGKKGYVLHILKETLYIMSLRRVRKEGMLKVINQHFLGVLPVLFMNRSIKHMPGYIMGGQLYNKRKKPIHQTLLKRYEKQLKQLWKEVFE